MFDVQVLKEDSLLIGRPRGVFNGELALEMVKFVEIKEMEIETGFNRFCDLTGIERIHLGLADVEALAARRSAYNPNLIQVKSAFLAANPLTLAIVGLYDALLKSSRIDVRSFQSVESAARWLGVEPIKLL
jgi:hypothetical protein